MEDISMRDRILKIAEEQMKAGGYASLNFGQIAKELETTRANLHYHYKNKETLAIEVTKRFMTDQEADLVKLSQAYNGNFPEFMAALEGFLWSHHECHGRVGACVCAQIIRQPDVPEALFELAQQHFNHFKSMMLEQIIASQNNKTMRADIDPLLVATQAGCMIAGLAQLALFATEEEREQMKGACKSWAQNYMI
jgi:TetR/AcrR family transcriptional regulator, transcriptional repressor for nem operon